MTKAVGILVCGCALAGGAHAQSAAVTLELGADGDYRSAGVGLRLAPVWADEWGGWHAAAHVEFALTHFRYEKSDNGPRSLDAAGGGASLRLTRGGGGLRPYAELGLTGNLFSRTHLGPKEFSTAFQFGEHIGVGVEFGERFSAGWRFAHYSNADIRKPNNGLDFQQLVVGMRF